MLPFILISLIIAFLVLVAVGALIFIRAAFWGEQDKAEHDNAVQAWRPPFVGGDALREWAAAAAERIATNRLAGGVTGDSVVQLATEIESGAVQGMLPLARPAELECIVPCSEAGQEEIGVTAPEVLAIAAEIREHQSRAEQRRIHDVVVDNAKEIASRAGAGSDSAIFQCPLRGQDMVCYAYGARPVQCRPRHAMSVAKGMGGRGVGLIGSPSGVPDEAQHEATVAQGVQIGLVRALKSAGLDANVYELNHALATALETPDAAERWAKGEKLF